MTKPALNRESGTALKGILVGAAFLIGIWVLFLLFGLFFLAITDHSISQALTRFPAVAKWSAIILFCMVAVVTFHGLVMVPAVAAAVSGHENGPLHFVRWLNAICAILLAGALVPEFYAYLVRQWNRDPLFCVGIILIAAFPIYYKIVKADRANKK